MLEFRRVANTVATICFTIALAVYIFADRYLAHVFSSSASPIVPIIVFALSSLAVYSGVFSVLLWVYQKFLHVRLFSIYDLSGEWFHVGVVEGTTSVRHGPVHVVSDVDRIRMSGTNYLEDGTFSSSWQSEAAAIVERKLVLLYVSEGVAPSHPMTRGAMVLSLMGSPPVKMLGVWNDTAPFTNRGTVTIFRDREEYQQRVKASRKAVSEAACPQQPTPASDDTGS